MMWSLRKSKAAEILLRLLKGPCYVRGLLFEVGGSAETLEMRIRELLEEGLVKEEVWEVWPFRKMLKLTRRGEDVARLLKVERNFFSAAKKIAAKEAPQRGRWLLMLLHSLGGEIRGATRLQKLLFLLNREQGVEIPYRFTPYMFGPHSPDVFEDALDLELAGYLRIENFVHEPSLSGDCVIERTYRLTLKGAQNAKRIHERLPANQKRALSSLKRFNEMRLTDLLKYVYTKYPKESRGI
ncbi:MAG: hypothetical protein QMD00_03195 [Hadesarchaea archaeon]|nr:hypothetical protein [Hadesarchaea archaeon]